jgi:hypothetical protein
MTPASGIEQCRVRNTAIPGPRSAELQARKSPTSPTPAS